MTIPGSGDLMPRRRRTRQGGGARRFVTIAVVLIVLGGAGFAGWRVFRHHGTSPVVKTRHCHIPAAAVAPSRPGQVKLEVMNTTKRIGLAASVRHRLKQRGFDVVSIGNSHPTVQHAVVQYPAKGKSGEEAARALREELPAATLEASKSATKVVLKIGTGFDGLSPTSKVAAARKADEQAAHPVRVCTTS